MAYSPTIYKYRTWSNRFHRAALLRNELYYASPAQFNDPFDFKITIDYSLLDSDSKREKYVDKLLEDSRQILSERRIDPIGKKKELMNRLVNDTSKMQDEFDSTRHFGADNRFGVISFSERWDSILMWSHYAENHKGFCIGYNRSQFEKSNLYGTAGGVNYTDYYPKIDPIGDNLVQEMFLESHTKASDWSYEKEYRLTKLWDKETPSFEERTLSVPNDFIEEVLLGLAISESDKTEIVKISQEKNIPVFAIVKKPRAFLLDKIRL